MFVFDVQGMEAHPYEERDQNVFFKTRELKTRVIELSPGGEIPSCEMDSYVIFYVLRGAAEVTVNQEKVNIQEGQVLITEPATLSMQTDRGVKLMGIQVRKE